MVYRMEPQQQQQQPRGFVNESHADRELRASLLPAGVPASAAGARWTTSTEAALGPQRSPQGPPHDSKQAMLDRIRHRLGTSPDAPRSTNMLSQLDAAGERCVVRAVRGSDTEQPVVEVVRGSARPVGELLEYSAGDLIIVVGQPSVLWWEGHVLTPRSRVAVDVCRCPPPPPPPPGPARPVQTCRPGDRSKPARPTLAGAASSSDRTRRLTRRRGRRLW